MTDQRLELSVVQVALRWFKKNKVRSVQLSVAAANFEARAVWGQLGFKPLLIQKRLDLDAYPATALLAQEPKKLRRKIVRRTAAEKP